MYKKRSEVQFSIFLCILSVTLAQLTGTADAAQVEEGLGSAAQGETPALDDQQLLAAATAGDSYAQYNVGLQLEEGLGNEKNLELAATWYAKAAEQNYPPAQYRLGRLYYRGEAIRQDLDFAKVWLERASANNDADAAYLLGQLYLGGTGVKQDLVESLKFSLRAAELGNPAAMQAVCMLRFIAANGLPQANSAISSARLTGNDEALEISTAISRQYQQILTMITLDKAIAFLNEAIELGNKSAVTYKFQQSPHLCTAVTEVE